MLSSDKYGSMLYDVRDEDDDTTEDASASGSLTLSDDTDDGVCSVSLLRGPRRGWD